MQTRLSWFRIGTRGGFLFASKILSGCIETKHSFLQPFNKETIQCSWYRIWPKFSVFSIHGLVAISITNCKCVMKVANFVPCAVSIAVCVGELVLLIH
jgi:hypothetical protein